MVRLVRMMNLNVFIHDYELLSPQIQYHGKTPINYFEHLDCQLSRGVPDTYYDQCLSYG